MKKRSNQKRDAPKKVRMDLYINGELYNTVTMNHRAGILERINEWTRLHARKGRDVWVDIKHAD